MPSLVLPSFSESTPYSAEPVVCQGTGRLQVKRRAHAQYQSVALRRVNKLVVCLNLLAGLSCLGFNLNALAKEGEPESGVKAVTVSQGDTLDKIALKVYPGSPLRLEVLREALMEKNPTAFTKGTPKMLMAGAVLSVPDHAEIVNKVLQKTDNTSKPKDAKWSGDGSGEMHRNWVRFP
jgi:phage tail protein X